MIGPEGLASTRHVGLLLGERLINMPVQVIPPMYRMLLDEIQWANEEVRHALSLSAHIFT